MGYVMIESKKAAPGSSPVTTSVASEATIDFKELRDPWSVDPCTQLGGRRKRIFFMCFIYTKWTIVYKSSTMRRTEPMLK